MVVGRNFFGEVGFLAPQEVIKVSSEIVFVIKVREVKIIKGVMACDVSPVEMFLENLGLLVSGLGVMEMRKVMWVKVRLGSVGLRHRKRKFSDL